MTNETVFWITTILVIILTIVGCKIDKVYSLERIRKNKRKYMNDPKKIEKLDDEQFKYDNESIGDTIIMCVFVGVTYAVSFGAYIVITR